MNIVEIREKSKQLLGNAYRLEVASEIFAHSDEKISAQELADLTGIRYPRIHEELKRLEAAGLLEASGIRTSTRTVDYKVVPTTYWQLASSLLAELKLRER